jgi:tetratricopeptide (TPR) repeat protein
VGCILRRIAAGENVFSRGERLFDRFRVDEVFAGGMGVVYAVTDVHTGRRYALKTVKRPADAAVLDRFREEARTWIGLGEHPHVVQAFWLIESPDPFLVLEYVKGESLAAILARGPLGVRRALDLAMQCASGLAYAHRKPLALGIGVVHRDVKPGNLLVTPEDHLKISDFGLARVWRGKEGEALGPSRTQGAGEGGAGTLAYMAPEQLRGEPADGRADVYALGLVLHEMITGRNPLAATEIREQLRLVLETVPPPLDDVPPALAALVASAVAKDPSERPRDAFELLAHLAQVARSLDHPWHVDPRSVPPPGRPAGIVVGAPFLRPRSPRAAAPWTAEVEVRGDVGPGPVEVVWSVPPVDGLEVLTPSARSRTRIEAGGTVQLAARLSLVAQREGSYRVPESRLSVTGPAGEAGYRVPAFDVEVPPSFVLPLVGRTKELSRLRTLLRAAMAGEGLAVLLHGETGAGKSRLLLEVARLAAREGVRTIESRAQASGQRPMRILNDLARELIGARENVRAAVNDLFGDDPPNARYFADLLLGEAAWEDAPLLHRWHALLKAVARKGPLVLLLDDLHLADEAAVRVVLDLAGRAREERTPVLVVGAVGGADRSEVRARKDAIKEARAEWARRGVKFPELKLKALGREDVEGLVDAVFPGHGFAQEAPWFAAALAKATRGNPFHVTEILRVLRKDEAAVVQERGEWRLAPDFTEERLRQLVPEGLEALVRARLAALPAEAREVAEHAAVIGEEFDAEVLAAAVGDPARTDRALRELEEQGILQLVDAARDRYRFWSAIAPTAAQRLLSEGGAERPRRLHLAVAEAMLRTYKGEDRVRRALSIAHHLRAGGETARALPFTLAGCARLMSLQLADRARRLLANAKPLVARPEVGATQRAQFDYLYGLACEASGHYDEAYESLTRYVESAVELPQDPGSLPRAYLRLGRIDQARGEYDRAHYSFGVARQLFAELGDMRKLAFVGNALAALALERGQLLAAIEHRDEAARLAEESGNEGAAVQALNLRGQLDLMLANHASAWAAFREAETRASAMGDRRRHAAALDGLGRVALANGYLEEARAFIERGMDLHAEIGDRRGLGVSLVHLADVTRALRRTEQALRHCRRARRVFEEMGYTDGVASARHRAGRLLRALGRTTAAIRELAAAAEEFDRVRLPERHAAFRDLGEALADAGSARAARTALARADRGEPEGAERLARRVASRTVRVRLALLEGDLRKARAVAARALEAARKTTGHAARIAAHLAVGEAALRGGELVEARRAAEDALAFAREEGDPLEAAAAERILAELAARAGRTGEASERAHRAARAYTGRADSGDGPARLLLALGRGLSRAEPARADRYLARARGCYQRLKGLGFRPPEGV